MNFQQYAICLSSILSITTHPNGISNEKYWLIYLLNLSYLFVSRFYLCICVCKYIHSFSLIHQNVKQVYSTDLFKWIDELKLFLTIWLQQRKHLHCFSTMLEIYLFYVFMVLFVFFFRFLSVWISIKLFTLGSFIIGSPSWAGWHTWMSVIHIIWRWNNPFFKITKKSFFLLISSIYLCMPPEVKLLHVWSIIDRYLKFME